MTAAAAASAAVAEQPGLFAFWSERRNNDVEWTTYTLFCIRISRCSGLLSLCVFISLFHFSSRIVLLAWSKFHLYFFFYGSNSSKHQLCLSCVPVSFLELTHVSLIHRYTNFSVNCRGFIFVVSFNLHSFNFVNVPLFRSVVNIFFCFLRKFYKSKLNTQSIFVSSIFVCWIRIVYCKQNLSQSLSRDSKFGECMYIEREKKEGRQ